MGVLGAGDGDGVWACAVVERRVCMECTPPCKWGEVGALCSA